MISYNQLSRHERRTIHHFTRVDIDLRRNPDDATRFLALMGEALELARIVRDLEGDFESAMHAMNLSSLRRCVL